MTPLWAMWKSWWRVPYVRRSASWMAVGLLASWLSFTMLLAPNQRAYETARKDLIRATARDAETRSRADIAARFRELSGLAEAMETRLSAGSSRSSMVEALTGLSSRAGTRIIHGANSVAKERAGTVPILHEITIEGNYTQVRAFLASVPKLPTLTVPVAVTIDASPGGTLVRARVQLVTYSDVGR